MKRSIFVLAAIFTLAACGKKADQPAASGDTVAANSPVTPGVPGYEKKDSYFRLPLASGKGDLDLAAYAGKPVMLMFFTETCPYCRKAGPAMEKLHRAYGPKGLNLMGICIQDEPEAALNFAKSLGITFPIAYNGRRIYKNYKAQGVPYIYLLDRGHRIFNVWEGYDDSYAPEMEKAIAALLARN